MKQLWLDMDMVAAEILDLPCGQAAVYSRRDPSAASANEDGVLVMPIDDNLRCAASGLAGHTADRIASNSAELPGKPDDASFVILRRN